jgi:hypothetical protein
MGAGASSVGKAKGADAATIAEGVQGLSATDKVVLKAAVQASMGGDSKSIADNVKSIAENRGQIHELSLCVMTNKQGIFEARSMMEENRANILQNYQAATTGNRQMAIENTDAIYRNRTAILDALKVNGSVEKNFRASKKNEAMVEYLQNQCLLNNRVAKINEKLSATNADLIAVNDLILKSNEEIVTFNTAQIEANTKLLTGITPKKATPEANAGRMGANKEKIAKIKERNDKYNAELGNLHAAIKENRKNVEANAATIKERRKLILENRKTIDERGLKIAALLRVDCFADVASALDGLSDEEKKNIQASLSGPESEAHAANRKNIAGNAATLHDLHLTVFGNQSKLLAVRSIIEENRALLLKNYAVAFAGNRLMVNQNTDCIFKNRIAILDAMQVEGQEQVNFRNTKLNKANVDFLEHRSLLNNRVAKTNAKMAEANAKLIEANSMVMSSNEEIVKFNSSAAETNKKLLEGIQPDKATPESNAARVAANTKGIAMIVDHSAKYDEKVEQMTKVALENRKKIIANAKDIDERRKNILQNRAGIVANGAKVSAQIRGK